MSMYRAPSATRRTAFAVLLAWWCVIFTGMVAPVVLAQQARHGMERLCSGELAPQWVVSPAAHDSDAGALHHLMDCPLCLPVLAPPVADVVTVGRFQGPSALPGAPQTLQWVHAIPWPPARGPPV